MVEGGKVSYTVTLSTGLLDIPINSQLDITTNVSGLTVDGPCTMNSGGDIPLRGNLGFNISANKTISCQVLVNVTSGHASNAEIAPFVVTAQWGGAAGDEYYVPPVQTLAVPVCTGGELAQPSSQVNEAELGTKYYTGADCNSDCSLNMLDVVTVTTCTRFWNPNTLSW